MKFTGAPLLGLVGASWAILWLVTQIAADPPLSAGATTITGVVLTELIIVTYLSFRRSPSNSGTTAFTSTRPPRDTVAEASRSIRNPSDRLITESATRSAALLLPLTDARSVEITDDSIVVGVAGTASSVGDPISPSAGRAIQKAATIRDENERGDLALATPLSTGSGPIGSLVLRFAPGTDVDIARIETLAKLASMHLEIAELTQQAQLAADAKLEALRAQINPHFLFNTLNTITSKSRTDPDGSRQLLGRLAEFFRYSIRQDGQYAEFSNEYFFVRTYLTIEQARFEDRLAVHYDIEPQALTVSVPVLIIQPLVENAVKHGLAASPEGGTVRLHARVDPLGGSIRITVSDDGVGMAEDELHTVLAGGSRSPDGGVGLSNISQRLQVLYGDRYTMNVRSSLGEGTKVELNLPLA